jgi:arginase
MNVHFLAVPYDSGHRQERMGRGPVVLLESGLLKLVSEQGATVTSEILESGEEHVAEIRSTFTLASQISERVSAIRALGGQSIVLSGNCNGALGTIAGLGSSTTAVLWFDAHGEFETPETTRSGFLDGMGLAIGTGVCWRNVAGQIAGFRPIPPSHITLVGVREMGSEEEENLSNSGIHVIRAESIRRQQHHDVVATALEKVQHCTSLYIHFDLDVLDPAVAAWNRWCPPAGLSVEQIVDMVREFAPHLPIGAIGFASYEPSADGDRQGARVAGELLLTCLEATKSRGADSFPAI